MIQRKRTYVYAAISIAIMTYIAIFWMFSLKLDHSITLKNNAILQQNIIKINSNWQFHWGDSPLDSCGHFQWLKKDSSKDGWIGFQFPGRPENTEKLKAIWIKTTLPQGKIENAVFRFKAPQQTIEVYLEDQLIYSYGKYDPFEKVRTPGSDWHFVELPEDYAGKTIYFRLHTPFPHYTGFLTEIALGNMSSHILDIFRENFMSIVFGCFFLLVGAAILILALFGSRMWRDITYLGLSSAFIGGWYISESRIPSLYLHIPISNIYAANFFIFIMPIWLLIYIEHAFTSRTDKHRIILRILWISHALLALVAFTCDMTGLISSLYFDKVLHVLLPITLLFMAYTIIKAAKNGIKGALLFISGLLVLGLTGLYDTFIMFYDTMPLLNTVRISYIGMLYFLFVLLINAGESLKQIYEGMEINSIENETNYKTLFTNMSDGFAYNKLEFDPNGRISKCIILEANNSFVEKTGLEKSKVIGMNMFSIFPEIETLNFSLNEAKNEAAATAELSGSNDPICLSSQWYRLSAFYPKKNYLGIIFSDVTGMKNAEETIRQQAYTDGMTGVFNRTYFEDVMLKMSGMLSEIKPLSIIAIDIDGLKITNDTFGHNVGDELLKKVAEIISSVFNSTNAIISRVGGDEFCIILPNTSYNIAQEKTEQIVKTTEEVNRQNPVVPISMSTGVATSCEEDHDDIYNIYRRADDDMYRYKISQSSSEKSKVIDMLLTALSERDYVSQGHVERLVEICQLMGNALDLHDTQKRNLILLSKVHDLGKIGIPDEILNKPGRLTAKEYERMKQHVKIGYNIASRSKELVTIAPLILHHHEHWNGGGYPDLLQGEEIPLECRILGIIDAFDAMTNDRPYHKGISKEEAILEIRRCSGKQFDPSISEKFIEIVSTAPVFS